MSRLKTRIGTGIPLLAARDEEGLRVASPISPTPTHARNSSCAAHAEPGAAPRASRCRAHHHPHALHEPRAFFAVHFVSCRPSRLRQGGLVA
eukprot:359082-Chlamydomonas_euryale.AAC.3